MPTRSSSLGNNVSTAVDREIGSQYDDVRVVAENIESVVTVADHIENVDTVATNIVDVHAVGGSIVDVRTVATNMNSVIAVEQDIVNVNTVAANVDNIDRIVAEVITNIDEIANASANATTSAANALTSEQNAKASELAAGVSEDNAAASEAVAIAKAGEASTSATAARNSELATAAMLDAFDDRYLGSFTVDPTTDNDGQPLLDGALYYNTVNNILKVYDVSNVMWYTIPQVQLSTLLDVQLTSVTTGDILNWNGTKWVNTSSVREHIASTSNPHSVTKAQVGLGSVNNTSDATKNVLSATKLTTPRAIALTGDVTGTVNFDGSAGVSITATVVDDSHNHVISNVDGLQTALNAKVDDAEKGAANGVATLDANGKVVLSQINDSILGQLEYQGVWNFTTMPTATEKGQYWVCTVAGNGYAVGDWAVYNGATFDKVDNTDAVSSVAGRTGAVTLTKSDVGLSNVDNTSDATKNVLSATKLTTARAIQLSGAVTGTADFDGSAAINIVTTHTADPVITLAGDATGSVTLTNLGSGTLTVSVVDDSHNHVVDNVDGLRAELDAKAPLASPALTGTPTAPTATVGDSSTKLATTAFVSAEIANDTYLKGTLDTNTTIMSKAAFNALAAERRANRAGSGFDEWGKHYTVVGGAVNDGMWTWNAQPNILLMGREDTNGTGTSRTNYPLANINGTVHKLYGVNSTTSTTMRDVEIILPPAPTVLPYGAVLTTEQIAMGVIKHADTSNSGLIVNGKFDTDTSGWYISNNSEIALVNNALSFSVATGYTGYVQNVVNIVPNKQYTFECNVSNSNMLLRLYLADNSFTDYHLSSGYNKLDITKNSTSLIFRFMPKTTSTVAIDNIAVFPADAISRSDLVFLESWHEDVSEKDFVYPLGNVQYLGGVTDGMSAIVNGAFSGSGTYSLFGNWQASGALVGKGYVWSTLSDAQKKAFVSNPENNCYLDGDKVIQVRYRMRVVAGIGDSWQNVIPYNNYLIAPSYVKPKGKQASIASDYGISDSLGIYGHGSSGWTSALPYATENGIFSGTSEYGSTTGFLAGSCNGQCFALPIALVHRRNQGAYHPVYNPNGTLKYRNFLNNASLDWYADNYASSIADTFDINLGVAGKPQSNTGYIGTVSGRPDGLFYDQVHESDITDLRMSSQKVEDYNRLIDREFNKLVAGTYRGSEGEWSITNKTQAQLGGYVGGITFVAGTTRVYRDSLRTFGLSSTDVDALLKSGRASLIVGSNVYKLTYNNSSECISSEVIATSSLTAIGTSSGWTTYTGFIVLSGGNYQTTRTKSNTMTHCDIIGSPANYPTSWKQSGVSGVPLVVAEDGTSLLPNGVLTTFKLSKKANATPLQVLKSTDRGATWTALAATTGYTFSTTTNAITLVAAPAATDLIMVTYQTHTSMAVAGVNSEVLAIGDVLGLSDPTLPYCQLPSTLLGKVATSAVIPAVKQGYKINGNFVLVSTKFYATSEWFPQHDHFNLGADSSPTVKTFPYLTRSNGKARLQLVFKEMKYSTANADWGDDTKFDIVDNVSTTTDFYGNTVLIGQKYAELPYFIEAKE